MFLRVLIYISIIMRQERAGAVLLPLRLAINIITGSGSYIR